MAQQEPHMPILPADTSAAPDIYDVFTSVYEDLCQERRLDQMTPDRVRAIMAVSGDEDPFWRKQALTAMGWVAEKLPGLVGENWSITIAMKAAGDPDMTVCGMARKALATVLKVVPQQAQQALDVILPLCSHESASERFFAHNVLWEILGASPETGFANKEAVSFVIKAGLADSSAPVQKAASITDTELSIVLSTQGPWRSRYVSQGARPSQPWPQ